MIKWHVVERDEPKYNPGITWSVCVCVCVRGVHTHGVTYVAYMDGHDIDAVLVYTYCIVYAPDNSPIRLGTKRKMFSPMFNTLVTWKCPLYRVDKHKSLI